MPKESLYCVKFNRKIHKKDGFVYHCERAEVNANPGNPGKQVCGVCNKEFKDERCLKIHLTKKKHWDAMQESPPASKQKSKRQRSPGGPSGTPRSKSNQRSQKYRKAVIENVARL